jgi:hypothetical protein
VNGKAFAVFNFKYRSLGQYMLELLYSHNAHTPTKPAALKALRVITSDDDGGTEVMEPPRDNSEINATPSQAIEAARSVKQASIALDVSFGLCTDSIVVGTQRAKR